MDSPSDQANAGPQPAKRTRRRTRRSRTLGFVAGFFVITFVLLLGYRAMVDTTLMSRYLYVVAVHTNWLLSGIGYSSNVEGGMDTTGREAAMRAELAAWRAGEEPPKILPESGPDETPLTTWEVFQHRLYSNSAIVATDRERMAMLTDLAGPPAEGTPEALTTYLKNRIDTLAEAYEEPVYREGADGEVITTSRNWGDPGAHQALKDATRLFANLPSAEEEPQVFIQQVNETARLLEESRQEQLNYLQQSVTNRSALATGTGPVIVYVHEPSTTQRLQELREEQAALAQADGAREGQDSRTAAFDERIAELNAQVQAGESVKGRSFHFRVIAECGAIQSISIFIAAVLAFPALLWKRLVGVFIGVPVLYAINVFRLATLGVIGAFVEKETFDFFHEVVWQGVYIVFVVVVWLIWMEVIVRNRKSGKEQAAS